MSLSPYSTCPKCGSDSIRRFNNGSLKCLDCGYENVSDVALIQEKAGDNKTKQDVRPPFVSIPAAATDSRWEKIGMKPSTRHPCPHDGILMERKRDDDGNVFFYCPKCTREFDIVNGTYEQHFRCLRDETVLLKKIGKGGEIIYVCQKCGREFKLENDRPKQMSFDCPYDDAILIKNHTDGGYEFYSCPTCRNTFSIKNGKPFMEKSATLEFLKNSGKTAKDISGAVGRSVKDMPEIFGKTARDTWQHFKKQETNILCPIDDSFLVEGTTAKGHHYYKCRACGKTYNLENGVLIEEKSSFDWLLGRHNFLKNEYEALRKKHLKKEGNALLGDAGYRKYVRDICPRCKQATLLARYKIGNAGETAGKDPDWYECSSCHYTKKASLWDYFKEKSGKLNWFDIAPKIMIFFLGLGLFCWELITFGGGDFGGDFWLFAIIGAIIGLISIILDFGERKEAEEEKKETEKEIMKQTVGGGSPAAASKWPKSGTTSEEELPNGYTPEQVEEERKLIDGETVEKTSKKQLYSGNKELDDEIDRKNNQKAKSDQ